jgi:zinc/manganese transport system substrate-binding protein
LPVVRHSYRVLAAAPAVGVALLASACSAADGSTHAAAGVIVAVGAENEYANVIGQVGGKYVQASAIMSNRNTDPHTCCSSGGPPARCGWPAAR